MKVYLNDEKTPVDLRLLYDILWGFKALCSRERDSVWNIYFLYWDDSYYQTFLHAPQLKGTTVFAHSTLLVIVDFHSYVNFMKVLSEYSKLEYWSQMAQKVRGKIQEIYGRSGRSMRYGISGISGKCKRSESRRSLIL